MLTSRDIAIPTQLFGSGGIILWKWEKINVLESFLLHFFK